MTLPHLVAVGRITEDDLHVYAFCMALLGLQSHQCLVDCLGPCVTCFKELAAY